MDVLIAVVVLSVAVFLVSIVRSSKPIIPPSK